MIKNIWFNSKNYNKNDIKLVKPFLKWVGGKGQLLSEIEKYYPFGNGKIKNMLNLLWAVELFYLIYSAIMI